jgi:MFS family permease
MVYVNTEKNSDRLNPLLLREIRQSLRSHIFSAIIILTAIFCLSVLAIGIIQQFNGRFDHADGLVIFRIVYYFLWAFACVILPIYSANRFRSEKSIGEFELLSITGIEPKKIIRGKLEASLLQTFLIVSVAAPFLTSCYLLRGVSGLEIIFYLFIFFLFTAGLVQLGIFLGSLPLPKNLFSILNLGFLLFLLVITPIAIAPIPAIIIAGILLFFSSFVLYLISVSLVSPRVGIIQNC